jgi:hypothetical protein
VLVFLAFDLLLVLSIIFYIILVIHSPSPSNSRVFFFFFFSSQKFLIAWKQKKKKTRIFCHKWLMLYKIFIRKSGNFYFYFLGKCCHFWGLPKSLLSLCCCLEKSLRKLSSINATSTLECSLPTFLLQKKNIYIYNKAYYNLISKDSNFYQGPMVTPLPMDITRLVPILLSRPIRLNHV